MGKKLIFIIQSRLVIGGPAKQTVLLSRALRKYDYDTVLISGSGDKHEKQLFDFIKEDDFQFHIIKEMGREIHFYDEITSFIKLCLYIRKYRPLIVHTNTAKAGAIGRIAGWVMRVPVLIHTFHGHVFHDYFSPIKTKVFIWLERMLSKISDIIIVISPLQYKDIVEVYRVSPPQKTRIIPLGFELDEFIAISPKNLNALDREVTTIGIVGRLVPIKNHKFAIEVVERLLKKGNNIKLKIIGDGELKEELNAFIQKRQLNDHIQITGWVLDVVEIYKEIDILILTSKNEGTPVTIIEANASGLPVVATNVGGVADIIKDGENGFLVEPGDIDTFTERLERLVKDVSLRKAMGEKGLKVVSEKYRQERLINDIKNLYDEILRQKNLT